MTWTLYRTGLTGSGSTQARKSRGSEVEKIRKPTAENADNADVKLATDPPSLKLRRGKTVRQDGGGWGVQTVL